LFGAAGQVTVSIGLAHYPSSSTSATQVLLLADQALYMAKSGGRNQIIVYPH
jgi:GGDEF domain-containing protein